MGKVENAVMALLHKQSRQLACRCIVACLATSPLPGHIAGEIEGTVALVLLTGGQLEWNLGLAGAIPWFTTATASAAGHVGLGLRSSPRASDIISAFKHTLHRPTSLCLFGQPKLANGQSCTVCQRAGMMRIKVKFSAFGCRLGLEVRASR